MKWAIHPLNTLKPILKKTSPEMYVSDYKGATFPNLKSTFSDFFCAYSLMTVFLFF